MNKRQIETIADSYLNIIIQTPYFTSRKVNKNDLEFFTEGLLKIKGKLNDGDVFIQTKDIKQINGVELK